jgi:micrococcal nuclease
MRLLPAATLLVTLAVPLPLDSAATARAPDREPPAAEAPEEADLGTVAVVRADEDGMIALADGRTLHLAEIDVVRGRDGRKARAALMELAEAGAFTLKGDGPIEDRYGRVTAQAYAANGRWVQEEMLWQGLARVATTGDHRAWAGELLKIERAARTHRVGLWANPEYAMRTPEQAARLVDTWQIVEGVVLAAREQRGSYYLEFGEDRARDLAVRIPAGVAKEMEADPATFAGRKVRVRGWIGKSIGPFVALDHAEQLELVGHARRVAAQ